MLRFLSRAARLVVVAGLAACAGAQQLQAETAERTATVGGTTVRYKVVLPKAYDPAKTYPAVLVFGGGPQTMNTVDGALARNFQAEAEKRGYIVIGVAAPDGDLFFDGGDRIFPAFFRQLLTAYRIEAGTFHIAGPSNGGIAAFHVAARHPEFVRSVTAFPGYLWQPSPAKLARLKGICVFAYVGENDDYRWHGEMKREVDALRAMGTLARYSEEQGQPHRIGTLADAGSARLYDDFEQARRSCALPR